MRVKIPKTNNWIPTKNKGKQSTDIESLSPINTAGFFKKTSNPHGWMCFKARINAEFGEKK